jgi:tetratricopeptide (TPR) repeat protein
VKDQRLAVHRSIVVVDVEGFGDQRRTNAHQVAVRDGLYGVMREAFGRAGISWDDCDREDRGDGVFVLVPAEVPKGLLAESLPPALVTALRAHNGAHPGPERIRMRMALHAGEVRYDEHGVTAASVNLAFRLLEADALKAALARSPGVLAVITSSWFFEEVVRHGGAVAAAGYRPVKVAVKETTAVGWICLPDLIDPAGRGSRGGLGRQEDPGPRLPGSVPRVWNIPARNPGFTGRRKLLAAVRRRLLAGDRAVALVLHGMSGVGKTQLAIEYAHRFADAYDLAWWVAAGQAGLIGEQFAELADVLSCARPGAGLAEIQRAVLGELRERERWLLIFDNAENPEDLAGRMPGGAGHVLITSRVHGWAEIAVPVEVDVLARPESVAILRRRVVPLSQADADLVAGALGDLALGVAQAAGYMAETGISAGEYTALLADRAAEILDQGRPSSYPRSLAVVIQLAFDRLRDDDPAAAEAASLCALLAAEPVPSDWFTRAAVHLPAPLAGKAADPVAWRQVLGRVGRSALGRVDGNGLQMHRLTQAIVRGYLGPERAAALRAAAEALLAASYPGDTAVPSTWPGWARMLPHLLAVDPAAASTTGLRQVACKAAFYLVRRGDARAGHDLAADLYRQWRDQRGPDDSDTLHAAAALAYALRETGAYRQARDLQEDIVIRRRRVLGDDHPDTLAAATSLAIALRAAGDLRTARELDEDTLARYRRVLGEDHRQALRSASNLANDLYYLGETQAARQLQEDTLTRRRQVLGEDHLDTLASAESLALALHALGDLRAARELDEDTLTRRRRVLGEDHPHTLTSASNLATDLRALGDLRAARELDEDTLTRRRRVLGEDHPHTLTSASNLATDLRSLGET